MLPGPGGLTTDGGKNDTFTKHRLNDEMINVSLKCHFGENKAESFFTSSTQAATFSESGEQFL